MDECSKKGARPWGICTEMTQVISIRCIVAPVAYQVILEPGIGQFREFEPRRGHTHTKIVGTFSCGRIDLRKAREGELVTLDEQSTSSGIAEPYARKKLKARTGEEKG